jgi:hypothetical protein
VSTSIKDRIAAAYKPGMALMDLAVLVFPPDHYPRCWRYATGGGPYAWVRILKPALSRHGYRCSSTVSHGQCLSSYQDTVWKKETA